MSTIEILQATAQAFDVTVDGLRSTRRDNQHAYARQAAMLLLRQLMPYLSLKAIGLELRRDHTTVIYGIEAAAQRRERDAYYQKLLTKISSIVGE